MSIFTLQDICNIEKGKQIDTSTLDELLPYRYINGGIKESGFYKDYNIDGETILISEGGASCGYISYIDEKIWHGCHCYALTNFKVLPKYLFYALKANQERIMALRTGAAMPNIKKTTLRNMQLPLHDDIGIQTSIIAVLDNIDMQITNRTRQLEKLDVLVKSRFIEMFGDPVLNEKKWITKSLRDMGTCKNGMNFRYNESGVELNCLGVGDFKDFSIITKVSILPIISLNEMPSKEYLLKDHDIVFVRSNGNKALVGRSVAIYPGDIPTTFSGFCIRYRITDEDIITSYLLSVLKTDSVRKMMVGRGANIQNLNQQILGKLMIPVPPFHLQAQFSDYVQQVDKSKFYCHLEYIYIHILAKI